MTCLPWLFMTTCCPLFVFLFVYQPLDSLPCPLCFSFHCKPGGESPSLPAELLLSLCYTWHTGWPTYNLKWLLTQVHCRTGEHHLLEYGAFQVPSQGRIQSSLLSCSSQTTLTVSLPLVCFYLILKMRVCSVCCCVNIKYIFIVFQTYVHIYKCYIYIMSTHGHMYSRYFKELFIKKSKCYKQTEFIFYILCR